MHLPCVAKYFQSNSEPHCPHCNDYWPHEVPGLCLPATCFPPGLWQGCVYARVCVPSIEGAPGRGAAGHPNKGSMCVRALGPMY